MRAISKNPIREFGGKILGFIEEDRDGNQQVLDFYGKILGTYDKRTNKTYDFYGRLKGDGNLLMMFLNFNR